MSGPTEYRSIDQQVRDFYAAQSPTAERLREIVELGRMRRRRRARRLWTAVAAVALLVLAGLWWSSRQQVLNLHRRVVDEVALNHRKDLAVDVPATGYPELSSALHKLPFQLVEPSAEALRDFRLLGGRYCSLQAQLAAQLKVQHRETGKPATLYVTELTEQLSSLGGTRRADDGITVEIWRQDGLIYALAVGP